MSTTTVAGALAATSLALIGPAAVAAPPPSTPDAMCFGLPADVVYDNIDDATYEGSDGPDVVVLAGRGRTTFEAGGGDDLVCATDVTGPIEISGGPGDDQLQGGPGHDYLSGDDGNDRLRGNRGNDILRGDGAAGQGSAPTDGSDELHGGDGDDVLHSTTQLSGTGGSDIADGGRGVDELWLYTSEVGVDLNAVAGTAAGGPVTDYFTGVEHFYGTPHDDVMSGTNGNDLLYGFSGSDRIDAWAGNDLVYAGDGVVRAGPGDDEFNDLAMAVPPGEPSLTTWMGDGDDRVVLNHAAGEFEGETGDDWFSWNDGIDVGSVDVSGGLDRDTLDWVSDEWILACAGTVDVPSGTFRCGEASMTIDSVEVFDGGRGGDTFIGGPVAETFWGWWGDDLYTGGGGDDRFYGYQGIDEVVGDDGFNRCFNIEAWTNCDRIE